MTISTMIVYWITGISMSPSTYYINMASFLAFAVCFPDVQVYFMMVIPIKIKWLAIIDVIYMGYEFIAVGKYKSLYSAAYGAAGVQYASQLIWATRVSIIVSVLNFILFYFGTRNMKRFAPKEMHRRYVYKKTSRQRQLLTELSISVLSAEELRRMGIILSSVTALSVMVTMNSVRSICTRTSILSNSIRKRN